MDTDCSDDEAIMSFVEKHEKTIMKPKNGSCGKGIFIFDKNDISSAKIPKGYVVEEFINQHSELERLNPSSVNTLRVMTFKGNIISCVLKVGGENSVVDNMSSKGLYGNVNIDCGITDSRFFDIELNQYCYHPSTGERLIGFEIPHWEDVKKVVSKAASIIPEMGYLGWDIAILPDGAAVIEANENPGHDLSCQSTVYIGLYEKIKEIEKAVRI